MLPQNTETSHLSNSESDTKSNTKATRCAWCGRDIVQTGSGRNRRYCGHSCRQRAYEQRRNLAGTSIPADAVILPHAAAEELADRLFELRCSAEDVAAAVADGDDAASISSLCQDLIRLARAAEKIRGSRGEAQA